MKIIAIIPARGGSKSIPRKNIMPLVGKPMIGYILETLKSVKEIDRIIVSTDDSEIANVSKNFGAEVPFIRHDELAQDDTPTLPVLQNVLEYLEKEEKYTPDYVLLVYPTSPLLRASRIIEAINLAKKYNADSVVSGIKDTKHYWIEEDNCWKRLYPKNIQNRQWTKPLFKENGAIYLSKITVLKTSIVSDYIIPLIMDEEETIDIDEPSDWKKVENIIGA